MKRFSGQRGQTVIILVIAMAIFLIGGIGLVVDGAHLYDELQMAQVAADSAAVAGAMSIFQGKNTGATAFPTSGIYTCTTSDSALPCQYARMNGFGGTAADTVKIDYPDCAATPNPCEGYEETLATSLPPGTPNQVRVTVIRNVKNSFIRMLGAALNTPVRTTAIAAIVSVQSPTPLLITDPFNENSLYLNGTNTLTICGGPTQSIQVNSANANAYYPPSSGMIDLSKAGPNDSGACDTGTGANFGIFGGPAGSGGGTVNKVSMGTDGQYIQPHSPISDPFAYVPPPGGSVTLPDGTVVNGPAIPSIAPAPITGIKKTDATNYGCTAPNAQGSTCTLYRPGKYGTCSGCTAFDFTNKSNILFAPGLYYVQGGGVKFKNANGGALPLQNPLLPNANTNPYSGTICSGCTSDPNTGDGMVIYDTGKASHNGSGFSIDTNAYIFFQGPTLTKTLPNGDIVPDAPYYGLTLWEDRESTNFVTHQLGQGNGCFNVTGTTYITPTRAIMEANPSLTSYQVAQYNGTPCGNTITKGDIVVSDLVMKGTASLKMNLIPYSFLDINQVALVAGGARP